MSSPSQADDLAVEPVEEDRVPRLVLDLRGDVQLLLLAGADHEHRQLDLDLPLAVVEAGRDGDERLPLRPRSSSPVQSILSWLKSRS